MRHYVYKVTNKHNGKFYIGVHSCGEEFLDSNYYGSGTAINKSLINYGKDSFDRVVVKECESRQEAFNLEELIVDENFIKRRDTYNCKTGGGVAKAYSLESRERMSQSHKGQRSWNKGMKGEYTTKKKGYVMPESTKEKLRVARKTQPHPMQGKHYVKKTCPKCGRSGQGGNMARYHFDNCKIPQGTHPQKPKFLVENLKTGVLFYVPTIKFLSEKLGIKANTIVTSVRRHGVYKDYTITKYNESSQSVED